MEVLNVDKVPKMEKGKSEGHLISPAAFVEGGIQEACEDSCSICLEAFSDNDPGTVTSCKHEFHLQCILEWCQRSSNCPMCWQAISLKDPSSQELLDAVEQERRFRFNPTRNSTIFRHPTLGDFELQHLPVGVNDGELEDRIIQHLAAAAAMGRTTHHVGRRDGSRNRPAAPTRPQFLVCPISAPAGAIQEQVEPVNAPVSVDPPRASTTLVTGRGGGGVVQRSSISGIADVADSQHGTSVIHRSSTGLSSLPDQDRAGPSELQTPSDTWKSRFSAISTRYKESISKSTRGWKERLFNKSPSMSNIGSEIRRDVNTGITNMSRVIERLEVQETDSQDQNRDSSSSSNLAALLSDAGESNANRVVTAGTHGGSN
ncbi:E3 ubiquitin-protein ligase RHF2A-like [Rutidosis leptorrhynchoides]|uniref:E3 ubiquitin-protein ligase RHF2A-like n=1 Tax=Rutidosis leptorrhynchoides TaxID=125765 RepID=UPI003A9A2831